MHNSVTRCIQFQSHKSAGCGADEAGIVAGTAQADTDSTAPPPIEFDAQQPGAHAVDIQLLIRQLKVGGHQRLVIFNNGLFRCRGVHRVVPAGAGFILRVPKFMFQSSLCEDPPALSPLQKPSAWAPKSPSGCACRRRVQRYNPKIQGWNSGRRFRVWSGQRPPALGHLQRSSVWAQRGPLGRTCQCMLCDLVPS